MGYEIKDTNFNAGRTTFLCDNPTIYAFRAADHKST